MAEDAGNLADLFVRIRADTSEVQAQLQTMVDSGQSLGEAMNALAASLPVSISAIGQVGDATAFAAAGLGEVSGGVEQARQELAEIQHQNYLKHLAEDAEHAGEGLHHLFGELLELAGITLTIEAFKELVVESVHLFAETEKVQFALGYMAKSSEVAEEEIGALKGTAQQLGLSFEAVLQSAQRMTAAGASIDSVRASMTAAADASAVTGYSFERTSGAIERMATMGVLSTRMLLPLKITTKEVADVMGVSVGEVAARFKDSSLTVEDRVNIMAQALSKFGGAGEQVANLTAGQMQRMKNAWQFAMENLGESVAPIVTTWIPELIKGIRVMVGTFELIVLGASFVKTTIVGSFKEAAIAVTGFGSAIWKMASHDYAGAAGAIALASAQIKETSQKTFDDMFVAAFESRQKLKKLFEEPEPPPKPAAKVAPKVAGPSYELQKAEIDAQAKHDAALVEMERMKYEEQAKEMGLSHAQQLATLQKFNAQEQQIEADKIAKLLALEKKKGEAEKDATLSGQLLAAKDKAAKDDLKLQLGVLSEKDKIFDQTVKDHVAALNKELAHEREVADHVKKLNEEMEKDRERAAEMAAQAAFKHGMASLENERAVAAARHSLHQITAFEMLRIDEEVTDKELAMERASLQDQLKMLDAKRELNVKEASERQAIIERLAAMEDATLNKGYLAGIKSATIAWDTLGIKSKAALTNQLSELQQSLEMLKQQGTTLSKVILQQDLWNAKINATRTMAAGMGGVLHSVGAAAQQAFNGLGASLANMIVSGGKFVDTLKQMGQQILGTLIQAVLQLAEAWLLNLIFGKAYNEGEIGAEAARGGAAAAASTAAIPIIGPALALAAGMAMFASIMGTFGPLAMAEGGMDIGAFAPLTQLHPREMVLPQDLADGVRGMVRGGGGNGAAAAGNHFDFRGASFTGVTQSLVRDVMNQAVRGIRAPLGVNAKF